MKRRILALLLFAALLLGEGFLRVQLPGDRLEEGMRLCHRLFLA